MHVRGEESLKLALRQPWVWSGSDFIFLAMANKIWWSVLSLCRLIFRLTVTLCGQFTQIFFVLCCSLGPQPNVPSLLARWVSRLLGVWCPGPAPCYCPLPFTFTFHISVFIHSLFLNCHWISFVFLLYDQRIYTHSVDPWLTHFLCELPGLLQARCCGPRGRAGLHMEQESQSKFLPWPGFGPWHCKRPRTLPLDHRTPLKEIRYKQTSVVPRLLLPSMRSDLLNHGK